MAPSWWLILTGLSAGLVWLLPLSGRRVFDKQAARFPGSLTVLVFHAFLNLAAATLLVVAAYRSFTPGEHRMWWVAFGVTAASLVLYSRSIFRDNPKDYYGLIVVTVMLTHMAAGMIFLVKALDDNSYQVKQGTVAGQGYVPSHLVSVCSGKPVFCTPIRVPNDWYLDVRDCTTYATCVVGRLHFGFDVRSQYPVGSTYPG